MDTGGDAGETRGAGGGVGYHADSRGIPASSMSVVRRFLGFGGENINTTRNKNDDQDKRSH